MMKESNNAKVFLICGKICSGKTTYTKKLIQAEKAVNLSVDEITLSLFGSHCGDMHDTYCQRTKNFLFNKSLEIVQNGINVILDWGFWSKKDREFAKTFYAENGIQTELHYIEITDEQWYQNIKKRNARLILEEPQKDDNGFYVPSDYYIDENLAKKISGLFEEPEQNEIDICVKQM